jgi:hypothetical protein
MFHTKKLFVACAMAVMLIAPAAHAESGAMTFGLAGGLAMPMGDFGDGFKTGFGGGVFGDYWVTSNVGIGADIMFNQMGGKDEFESALGVDKITGTLMQFGGHVKYAFASGSSISPWIQGGLAAYNGRTKVEDGGLSSENTSTDLGLNVGGGLNFWSSPTMSLGAAATFHDVMTDPDAEQLFNLGLHLTFSTTGTSTMGGR